MKARRYSEMLLEELNDRSAHWEDIAEIDDDILLYHRATGLTVRVNYVPGRNVNLMPMLAQLHGGSLVRSRVGAVVRLENCNVIEAVNVLLDHYEVWRSWETEATANVNDSIVQTRHIRDTLNGLARKANAPQEVAGNGFSLQAADDGLSVTCSMDNHVISVTFNGLKPEEAGAMMEVVSDTAWS